jgi:hypothetical protein
MHTQRQGGDSMCLLLFFQNKERRLKGEITVGIEK